MNRGTDERRKWELASVSGGSTFSLATYGVGSLIRGFVGLTAVGAGKSLWAAEGHWERG